MSQLLQKIGPSFAESMGSVFSMLTGREFGVVPGTTESMDHEAVSNLYTGAVVYVKATYTKGVSGHMIFSLPLQEGTQLVDLMLGGDGAASTELAGDSRDALAETFNQIMGSANQALSDLAGETLSISNVEIFSTEAGQPEGLQELLGAGSFDVLSLSTTQENLATTIHLLIPDMLSEQLKRKLGMGQPPEQVPVPAPASAAAASPSASQPSAPAPTPVAAGPTNSGSRQSSVDTGNLDLLLDIELPVMVRMGQTEMALGELLKLTPGSILELNRAADAPVELLVNGKQIAKGEVVVVDGNFAFRITEIESTDTRIRSLS
ncbi:MAG: flagellar motor switch protein FliN [Holophaga sp.]|nr:flagellar motor switch protein FliN [Holophaga sp.]